MTVPVWHHDLLHRIADLLERDRYTLFGGAARDLLADHRGDVHDLDIAFYGTPTDARALADRLATDPRIRQVTPVRDYWIFYRRPLTMFTAEFSGITLDLNLMTCPLQAHFDVETVQWSYPQLEIEDPHHVASGPVDRIRLLGSLDDENPVLLLNRALRLASKYGLPLRGQPLIATLCERASRWRSTDPFHGRDAHDAHHRTIADTAIRSTNATAFLTDCLLSGVVDARLRPLAEALRAHPAHIGYLGEQLDRTSWWQVADRLVGGPAAVWRSHATSLTDDPKPDHEGPSRTCTGVDLPRWIALPVRLPA